LSLRATWNSLIISTLLTGGSMFFCTLAGYAFAKHQFIGKDVIFLTLLATMMIPAPCCFVPGFCCTAISAGWTPGFRDRAGAGRSLRGVPRPPVHRKDSR